MSNVTRLFRELRKQNYIAKQRAGDCNSCALSSYPELEVWTIDQGYYKNKTYVYFQVIEGTIIRDALKKLNIPYLWEGTDRDAFEVVELG